MPGKAKEGVWKGGGPVKSGYPVRRDVLVGNALSPVPEVEDLDIEPVRVEAKKGGKGLDVVLSVPQKKTLLLAGRFGLPRRLIAEALGISEHSLNRLLKNDEKLFRRFKQENAKMKMDIAKCAVQQALGGSIPMLTFLCKTMLGWRETNRVEITGGDGERIESIAITRSMSAEDAAQAYAAFRKNPEKAEVG